MHHHRETDPAFVSSVDGMSSGPHGLDHGDVVEHETVVPTAVGDLRAVLRVPAVRAPLPGVVLVDGSGDGDRHGWGGWPEWIGDAGAVVLRHDKPGCGGPPGDWTEQSFHDRAAESLAALDVLRGHPATRGRPVGLHGVSQGGWVALLAASLRPDAVDFVVCHSGPGTSPAAQERGRIRTALEAEGHDAATVAEAMAWVDDRTARLLAGEACEAVLRDQERHGDRPWYPTVSHPYDTVDQLRFAARVLGFDPTAVMREVRCPVLVLLGGADPVVQAQESLAAFAQHLPPDPAHGFAVLPGADHGLFVAEPDAAVPRREQLARAYLPMLAGFLADRAAEAPGRP